MNEFQLIEKIKTWIPRKLQGPLAIGDDAAVLDFPAGKKLVFTADTIVEGIDFYSSPAKRNQPGWINARSAGRKALAVNLSDLAAMGAKPFACTISLGIPKSIEEAWLKDFYRGFTTLAAEYGVLCAGGDLTASERFFASIALTGSANQGDWIARSGARPGDWIGVTGALGGSLKRKHAQFEPRIAEAEFLTRQGQPSSMIDISDGLLQDLGHLLESSKTGAVLEMLQIPISEDAVSLSNDHPLKALERACTDGEDFELLFTVKPSKKENLERQWKKRFPKVPLTWIGKMVKGNGKVTWLLNGKKISAPRFKSKGFQHF